MKGKNLKILCILIFLLIIMRVPILFFSFDNIYYDADELSRGALAKEIIEGPMLALLDYVEADAEVYEGGRILSAISIAPFFLIFGDNYFSVKLAAVFCSVITLILWYILLLRLFNTKVAFFWGFLFVFSPPFYTIASLITWGAHAEYYFFTALFLIFLHKIIFKDGLEKTKYVTWVIFGALSGLSIWIIQNNIIVLLTCFSIFFLKDVKFFFKKPFLIYMLSFLIGYSPGIYHFFSRHWQYSMGCDSIFKLHPREGISTWLPKIKMLVSEYLPRSFMFSTDLVSYIYYFIFVFALIYVIWINRGTFFNIFAYFIGKLAPKRKLIASNMLSSEFIFLVYLAIYLFAYTIGGLSVWDDDEGYLRYKYLSIIYPVIFSVISFLLCRLWEARHIKTALALFFFLLSVGIYEDTKLISLNNFGEPFRQRGYSYYELGDRVSGARTIKGIATTLGHLRWINPKHGPDFLIGLAAGMVFNRAINTDTEGILNLFKSMPQDYQSFLYQGLGIGLNDSLLNEPEEAKKLFGNFNPKIPDRYRSGFYRSIGEGIVINATKIPEVKPTINFISRNADIRYFRDFYEGIGKGLKTIGDPEWNVYILNSIEEKYRIFVISGLKNAA